MATKQQRKTHTRKTRQAAEKVRTRLEIAAIGPGWGRPNSREEAAAMSIERLKRIVASNRRMGPPSFLAGNDLAFAAAIFAGMDAKRR